MAKMNFINGGYIGKLGETYGERQRAETYVKQIPFSHAPRSTRQRKANYAFISLNRMCAQLAKKYWDYFGINAKSCYKNNALVKMLRIIIKDGIFNPKNLYDYIPQKIIYNDEVGIRINYDYSVNLNYRFSYLNGSYQDYRFLDVLVDNNGLIHYSSLHQTWEDRLVVMLNGHAINSLYYFSWVFVKNTGKWRVFSPNVVKEFMWVYYQEVFYFDNIQWEVQPVAWESVFYMPSAQSYVENTTLYINRFKEY